MLLAQPDYGEQATEIAEQLVRVGKVDIVVVDRWLLSFRRVNWMETWAILTWGSMPA